MTKRKKKYVVVACGSGIATSTMVSGQIQDMCKEHGVDIDIHSCTIMDLPFEAEGADLIVTTSKYGREVGTRVISGMPLLTGIGREEALQEILDALREE